MNTPLDLNDLFRMEILSATTKAGETRFEPIKSIKCETLDEPELQFFKGQSYCPKSYGLKVQGNTDLKKGTDVIVQIMHKNDCLDSRETCSEQQNNTLSSIAEYDEITLQFFMEQEYLDFKNFTHPFQKITKTIPPITLYDDREFKQI